MKALLATLALVPLLAPSSPVLAEDPRFDRLDAGEIVIRLGEISQEERMVLEELKHIGGIPRVIATRCQRADGTYYGTAGIAARVGLCQRFRLRPPLFLAEGLIGSIMAFAARLRLSQRLRLRPPLSH